MLAAAEIPVPRPTLGQTPTLVDYLVTQFMRSTPLTAHQREALDSFRATATQILLANPPIGYRHESANFVLRLKDPAEISEVTIPCGDGPNLSGRTGDGRMAPEPNGPSHVQV